MNKILRTIKHQFGHNKEIYRLLHRRKKDVTRAAKQFQPWDYSYLLKTEREMLRYMRDFYYSNLPIAKDHERVGLICSIMVYLLDVYLNNIELSSKHINEKNARRFMNHTEYMYLLSCRENPICTIDMGENEEPCSFNKHRTTLEELYQIKALTLYHKMRERYLKEIWD